MQESYFDVYLDEQRLAKFAQNIGSTINVSGTLSARNVYYDIKRDLRYIKQVKDKAEVYLRSGGTMTGETEWLLDNWYIAEKEAKDTLMYFKRREELRCSDESGKAVIIEIASAFLRSGKNEVGAERLEIFLKNLQTSFFLTEKELYLFVPSLKASLVAALRHACEVISACAENSFTDEDNTDSIKTISNIFTSLKTLADIDISSILERVNLVDRILLDDPDGTYPLLDETTRSNYRYELSQIAKECNMSEYDAAKLTIKLATSGNGIERHVGYYIYDMPLGKAKKKSDGSWYIGFNIVITLFLSFFAGFVLNNLLIAALLVFPISQGIKNIIDFIILKTVRPKHIPRLELKDGIPEEGKTLCVISALLTNKGSGREYARLLEEYRLLNRDCGENLIFGILGDLKESGSKENSEDKQISENACEAIKDLNNKYGGGFFLFLRERQLNKRDGKYMSWERKRGAILELVRLIKNKPTGMRCFQGDKDGIKDVKYIITLDSDTRPGAGSVRELVGAMLHPLNRPQIDKKSKTVVRGSGIIQPRVSINLSAANVSDFSRIIAGQGGVDPYGSTAGEVYHDLFGCGSFVGKGIIDTDTYYYCLNDAFPDNTVLSHDMLEGEYLKCQYAGDVEFTDGFPYKVVSYYERMHRWIRGDWQNVVRLGTRVKNDRGEKIKNPLKQLSRWKIFDNLRRSLSPVFTFIALYIAMFTGVRYFWISAIIVLMSVMSGVVLSSVDVAIRQPKSIKVKYYSRIIPGFAGAMLNTLINMIFLPYEAVICFGAITTALYRTFASHKNMLSWTTADLTEQRLKNSIHGIYIKMWPTVVLGAGALLFSPYSIGIAAGIVWVLSPLYAWAISRKNKEKNRISESSSLFLKRCAGDIWRYFADFIGPEYNYLPPDNWQEKPAAGVAARTSPTNIGLALLSAVSAMDLTLCTDNVALGMIENMLTTIERMDKWHGHLYNWYNIENLKCLDPRYVSTVDSGNFAGCLITLRQALLERKTEYATKLAERADQIYRCMDFSLLYDEQRRLFFIGWDVNKDAPTKSWYDLMASEARLTSYIAIAKGDVPRKHWRHLGRAMVSMDNFTGMVSWTGTMFEYLMPNIIMPCYKNSMLYESARFSIYVQKRSVRNIPWGMSESGYYAFDPELNYRYKAHGLQRLALKRGMGKDRVISPYSTFITLPFNNINSGIRNLKSLKKLGVEGRYGFYEAVDFTPSRCGKRGYEIVQSYMSHHLGMSVISIDNTLNNYVMQKRFTADVEMSAFKELLQEKIPFGKMILRATSEEKIVKSKKSRKIQWKQELKDTDFWTPKMGILSNGLYSVIMSETGASKSMCRGKILTRFIPCQDSEDVGVAFWLKTGEKYSSLLPCMQPENVQFTSIFSTDSISIKGEYDDFVSEIKTRVADDEYGEIRNIYLKNKSDFPRSTELIIFFRPVMDYENDYFAHSAFSKLGLEIYKSDGAIVIKRIFRDGKSYYAAVALSESFDFFTSSEDLLGRQSLKIVENFEGFNTKKRIPIDPCVCMKVKLDFAAGEEKNVNFSLAAAVSEEAATVSVKRMVLTNVGDSGEYVKQLESELKMSMQDIDYAMSLITPLVYDLGSKKIMADMIKNYHGGQRGLWRFGISGDVPIMAVYMDKTDGKEKSDKYINIHEFLRRCGLNYDLVFLTNDGGDYMKLSADAIMNKLRAINAEEVFRAKGGVHIADISDREAEISVTAMARVVLKGEDLDFRSRNTDLPVKRITALLTHEDKIFQWYFDKSGEFVLRCKNTLPPVAWSNVLANDNYGYIATECGTGHMWYKNSRENKINSWKNDSQTTEGTEKLGIMIDGKTISLFAAFDGYETTVKYGYGYARWEKQIGDYLIKTTAFVPSNESARVIMIESSRPDILVSYFTELVLGVDIRNSSGIVTSCDGSVISAVNNGNTEYPGTKFYVIPSNKIEGFTCNKKSYMYGIMDGDCGSGKVSCISAEYKLSDGKLILVTGCGNYESMLRLSNWDYAKSALVDTERFWNNKVGKIKIKSPNMRLDEYMNGWSMYQTLCCRIKARTSLYQCGGAYGFRDQLQDALALVYADAGETLKIILNAAQHQYEEGDVQHWWHPGEDGGRDKGVRTRCSDDLLWLPYVLCEYIEKTGDVSACGLKAKYLKSPVLRENEDERYEVPEKSDICDTLYVHCIKAVELFISRGIGEHGLALIGSGDWNDGMNRVGNEGRGESVWLTWFGAAVLEKMYALSKRIAEKEDRSVFIKLSQSLVKAGENAWDGKWFLRGYFDNGDKLGSEENDQCRIDSIAQSFSAVPSGVNEEKVKQAVISACSNLIDRDNRLVKLFDPPFANGGNDPGYIKAYGPGIRENGGQYTHGAIWLAMGCVDIGLKDRGYEILDLILPQNRNITVYKNEPYVLSADVYSNSDNIGRGGWSWYTGSAGWYYTVVMEKILGIRLKDGSLYVSPNLPDDWTGYEAQVYTEAGRVDINVKKSESGVYTIKINGKELVGGIKFMENQNIDGEVNLQ